MRTYEAILLAANALLAMYASMVNFQVANAKPNQPYRSVWFPIALLAAFYATVNLLYLGGILSLDLRDIISPLVSLAVWPLVWIRPALVNTQVNSSVSEAITRLSDAIEEENHELE